jgi:hypothetical protein
MAGVHSPFLGPLPDEHVACGVTGPKGNDAPASSRPSVDPLTFLTQAHRFGMKDFDVYAHHPYYASPTQGPTALPKGKTTVTLGNINLLIRLLTRLYGNKPLWITEYGYQTRPPDRSFGVSWTKQAKYLSQAYAIARKNPRIGMMLWFLLRDESRLAGWQSGLMTVGGKHKPAYNAFRRLKH